MADQLTFKTFKNGKIYLMYKNVRLGYAQLLDIQTTTAYLQQLMVKESYQNFGHGTLLLREAIKRAYNAGCESIRLYVRVENINALRLYRREGFFIVYRRSDKKFHLMAKQLNNG